jgi:hypothetical protein
MIPLAEVPSQVICRGVPVGAVGDRPDLASGTRLAAHHPSVGQSGIGTTGQYPRQDLIPGNMDDGFHHRDDEVVLGVRATRGFRLAAKFSVQPGMPAAASGRA